MSQNDLPPNPKAAYGAQKPDLSLIPPVSLAHEAMAFEVGDRKYGAYNWRDKAVEARTYVAAAQRHIGDWLDGTECAADSGVHNLGHAIACLAILLDAQEQGNMIDNRPIAGRSAEVLERLKAQKIAAAAPVCPAADPLCPPPHDLDGARVMIRISGHPCHGQTGTIREVYPSDGQNAEGVWVDTGGAGTGQSALVCRLSDVTPLPPEPAAPRRPQVGDRVRIVEHPDSSWGGFVGRTGKIVKDDGSCVPFNVRLDWDDDVRRGYPAGLWCIAQSVEVLP